MNPFNLSAYPMSYPPPSRQAPPEFRPVTQDRRERYFDDNQYQQDQQRSQQFEPLNPPPQNPNQFASPVRYASLTGEKEPSPFPFRLDRVRHSSLTNNGGQAPYYHQRMSPPPPMMTVHRDPYEQPFECLPHQRTSLPYGDRPMTSLRPISPDFYSRGSYDRNSQRLYPGDIPIKNEFDSYTYTSTKPTRMSMSEESESRSYSAPIKTAVPRVVPDKDVLMTPEYVGRKEFATMEDAVAVLTQWAESQNVTLRKGSGNNKTMKDGTKKKIVLVCQCSGKYRSCSYSPRGGSASNSSCEDALAPAKTPKKRRSKKTECPFRINLNYRANSNTWNITKMILQHNHP
uniref:FAR1 domain-containing protein n=1 Tax=Entamoeba invadens TaxID=33085 RepID=S0B742_ENTIV|nr:hypothetical protein [Entamoeba invadens]